MTTLRRFLAIQALLLWQGGFLFYAAVVVPIGSRELGASSQGLVTRHVTDVLNIIGCVALVVLAWEQLKRAGAFRWLLWTAMVLMQAALVVLHGRIEAHVDSNLSDYAAFYNWHRVYLIVSALLWTAATVYVAVMLRNWRTKASD